MAITLTPARLIELLIESERQGVSLVKFENSALDLWDKNSEIIGHLDLISEEIEVERGAATASKKTFEIYQMERRRRSPGPFFLKFLDFEGKFKTQRKLLMDFLVMAEKHQKGFLRDLGPATQKTKLRLVARKIEDLHEDAEMAREHGKSLGNGYYVYALQSFSGVKGYIQTSADVLGLQYGKDIIVSDLSA